MTNKQAKFIVIDGIDASGKATQTDLLIKRLKKNGQEVKTASFPQYNQKSAGLIEEYLSGKYGSAEEVGPYRASCFYACDRYDASFKIKNWLNAGYTIITNRYVTANLGHQGAKIQDEKERERFFDWVLDLEYNIFQIPKPDFTLILNVAAEISQSLGKKRNLKEWLGKTKDIHEDDLNHLKKAEKTYLEVAKIHKNTELIQCVENEAMLSREEIHEKIWKVLNA